MESCLLTAIDAAVDQAVPADWPRVQPARLPSRGGIRARHAFRLQHGAGPAAYLVIVAAPTFERRTTEVRHDLESLVEHILSRGANLLLLHDGLEDYDYWLGDELSCAHPRFLTLPCTWNGADAYTVEPTADGPQSLADAIRELWSGGLFYVGPADGRQTVGVEVMRDRCRRCGAPLRTVTGIVFPDRPLADWSRPDWRYFHQLLELAYIPNPLLRQLAAAVDARRDAGETALTPIRWHFSNTATHAYWAAECPACQAFRGAFPVLEDRLGLLHSLESRRSGALSYLPLTLDVPLDGLRALTRGFEINPHTCAVGWYRTRDRPADAVPTAGAPASAALDGHGAAALGLVDTSPTAPPAPAAFTAPPAQTAFTAAPAPAALPRPLPTPRRSLRDLPGVSQAATSATRLGEILLRWLHRPAQPWSSK